MAIGGMGGWSFVHRHGPVLSVFVLALQVVWVFGLLELLALF